MRNEIQVGRYSQLLARLLSMDEGAPSPTLATDIFPTLALEMDRPEWKFLAGVRLCAASVTDAAVAGQYSHCVLTNPTASGILCVVTNFLARPTGGAGGTWGIQAVSIAGGSAGYAVDSRWSAIGNLNGACLLQTYTNAVAVPGINGRWGAASSTSLTDRRRDIVLSPGYQLIVQTDTVNVGLTVEFDYYERPLLPSEAR